jgi:hypothetical protein
MHELQPIYVNLWNSNGGENLYLFVPGGNRSARHTVQLRVAIDTHASLSRYVSSQ